MRSIALLLLLVLSRSSFADAPLKPKPLTMKDADTGVVIYADACSNGGNSDDANRIKYVAKMLANKSSKIAKLKAQLERDNENFVAELGTWEHTYNLRDGCGEYSKSFSALLYIRSTMGNSHELFTKYLVTIDDEVAGQERTLSVRSIQPIDVRSAP